MAKALLVATLTVLSCAPEQPRTVVVEPSGPSASVVAELRSEIARLETELAAARAELAATTTTTTTTVIPRARTAPSARARGGCGPWQELVGAYDWDVGTACRVLWCESRGDPNARNGRHHGLFQIADGPFEPAQNVALAHSMWQRRGWQPWDASRRCWAA